MIQNSPALGPSWYSCFISRHYPPELVSCMWLPRGVEQFFEAALARLVEIKEALKDQERTTRYTSQAANEERGETPRIIAAAIRASHEDVPAYEKSQREREYTQQGKMLRAAWATAVFTALAFGAASIYACIAGRQLEEIKRTNNLTQQALKDNIGAVTQTLTKMQGQIDQMTRQSQIFDWQKQSDISTHRPIVQPKDFILVDGPAGKECQTRWENVGTTPTKNLTITWSCQPSPPSTWPPRKQLKNTFLIALPPNPEIMAYDYIEVSQKDVDALNSGGSIYFFGKVTYGDVFPESKPHEIEYCNRMYKFQGQTRTPPCQVNANDPHPRKYDCFDDECKDYKELKN